MSDERAFAPACRALRDGIIEHYRDRGEAIDDGPGLRTLDTNTTLVPQRAGLLVELARGRGFGSLEGLEVADLGCGFGAIALYFASLGARVTGIDPNRDRLEVPAAVAAGLGLPASFRRGWIEAASLPDSSFDLLVLNNSFCYVTDRSDRREALRNAFRLARPGAGLVMRNPSVGAPLDPFTGLPLVHQLPGRLAAPALRLTARGRVRSQVKLMTAGAARRELRRAGFSEVRVEHGAGERRPARYQHLTALRLRGRPADESSA